MLRPDKRKPKLRTYKAYDLEWYPDTLELRLIGCYDGAKYNAFTRVTDFLNHELTRSNRGTWYYAHAGGLYDFQFLLEELRKAGYEMEAAFSGSSAVVVKVRRDDLEWFFLDSYWLLRSPLREIGIWLGSPKGDCAFDAPLPELMVYNEQDCRILWHGIEFFENMILNLGGQLQRTIASTAMSLFRRRFLTRDIHTMPLINEPARHAYIGSRVEVFQTKCENALYYDINSSFPHAMLQPMPANCIGSMRRLPKRLDMFLADVTIRVPESDIPPLPYRDVHNRVFFPHGQWRSWFTNADIDLAVQSGCDIEKVHRVYIFDSFTDLAEYADTIYTLRRRASSDAEKYVLKILLNSLYGKFGERKLKESMLVNMPKETIKQYSTRRFVSHGIYLVEKENDIPHEWVPIAATITAHARRSLYDHIRKVTELYYCDTDGFGCSVDNVLPTGDELGALKLEKEIEAGHFIAPKLYAMKERGKDWKVKAKGFSKVKRQAQEKSRGLSYPEFLELLNHREIEVETFSRLRSTIKEPDMAPRAGTRTKTWRGKVRPKRRELTNGQTEPWHVDDLKT